MSKKPVEICLWCGEEMEEGTIHLPTENKGKCVLTSGKLKRTSARHPVGLIGSEELFNMKEQIQRTIFDQIIWKFGTKCGAHTIVVNWQMSIMNFCQVLLEDTQKKILAGAHLTYLEEMEGKVN